MDSRRLELQTVEGTSRVSFQLTQDVFIEADGTNRSFVIHITESREGLLIFWIEAAPEQIDDFEDAAQLLAESLVLE